MVKRKSKSLLSGTSDFKSDEYLAKSLLFHLWKSSQEKTFSSILEKIPDNDTYYIEHREGTNAFGIRKKTGRKTRRKRQSH